MPEGPEVETVVRTLKTLICGKKIINLDIYYDNIIEYPSINEFKKCIGQTIKDIRRKGKWIFFELDNYFILSHLRMEGKYFIKDNTRELLKHEHVIFHLNDGVELRYHDTRKFGKFHLVEKTKIEEYKIIKELGIDPFDDEFTPKYLLKTVNNSNIAIKTLLLDQKRILGIGNIYANEILFLSKINPTIKGKDINIEQCEMMVKYTKSVLEEAIKKGGTTIKSYTSIEGVTGLFQHQLLVHGKEVCPKCKSLLNKIKVNGRGTYYCKNCQK